MIVVHVTAATAWSHVWIDSLVEHESVMDVRSSGGSMASWADTQADIDAYGVVPSYCSLHVMYLSHSALTMLAYTAPTVRLPEPASALVEPDPHARSAATASGKSAVVTVGV
jgi:hypothetical protein